MSPIFPMYSTISVTFLSLFRLANRSTQKCPHCVKFEGQNAAPNTSLGGLPALPKIPSLIGAAHGGEGSGQEDRQSPVFGSRWRQWPHAMHPYIDNVTSDVLQS